MKDLIVITAHCPTDEQVDKLEKCVESVLITGYHILLISHTHVPLHIQKKCNYYFYDYLNEVSDDYNLFPFNSFSTSDFILQSRFLQKSFYGFAIYRMFSIASQIASNFGYEKLHHIEYDCELIDKTLIDEHTSILDEYKSVIYTHDGSPDGFLFGSLKSFRVDSLPEKFKTYDKHYIENEIRGMEPKHLEFLTKRLFIDSGMVYFKNSNELTIDRFKKGPKFTDRGLYFTLYYNPDNDSINIFYQSTKSHVENIVVIVNDYEVTRFVAKPKHWQIYHLGKIDEVNRVRIDNSEKCLYEKSLDNEIKQVFKTESYITFYEKNS